MGASLAILLVALAQPSVASAAGCLGKYAHPSTPLSQQLGYLEALIAETPGQVEIAPLESPRKPCTGVFCTGNPARPIPPATPSTSHHSQNESWAILSVPDGDQTSIAFREFDRDNIPVPLVYGPSVFHPPRASALS